MSNAAKYKELEVFNFIKARINEGTSPTIREIMDGLGFRSTSTVHRYVNALLEKGLLEKGSNMNRSLKLPGNPSAAVPVMGTVTAGMPITAFEEITGYVGFEADGVDPDDLFALRIRGESMINAGILDGDIVIVEKTSYANNGDIVVAFVDGEDATVKRFYKEDGHYRLQPENDYMEPIILDECEILGRVVGLKRYY